MTNELHLVFIGTVHQLSRLLIGVDSIPLIVGGLSFWGLEIGLREPGGSPLRGTIKGELGSG
jgi:hypothetical protein